MLDKTAFTSKTNSGQIICVNRGLSRLKFLLLNISSTTIGAGRKSFFTGHIHAFKMFNLTISFGFAIVWPTDLPTFFNQNIMSPSALRWPFARFSLDNFNLTKLSNWNRIYLSVTIIEPCVLASHLLVFCDHLTISNQVKINLKGLRTTFGVGVAC